MTTVTGELVNGDSRYDSWLRFRMESGGSIDLSSLDTITGKTWFDVQVASYELPELRTAQSTFFTVGAASSLNLPKLETMNGRNTGMNIGDGATLNAGELLSFDNGSLSVGEAGVLNAGKLVSLSASITIGESGAVNAPMLTQLTNSTYTHRPNQTFNVGPVANIDGSELVVTEGGTLILSQVASYTNTLSDHRANITLLSTDESSTLDLSQVQSFTSAGYGWDGGFDASPGNAWNRDVIAKNNSMIDLSSVTTITGELVNSDSRYDTWLRFRMESGGNIDLSSVASISGRTWFDVGEQGHLKLGNLAITANSRFEMRHISSTVDVAGSLFLSSTSQFVMAPGATIQVGGDFLFQHTDETKLDFDIGVLHLNGSSMQFLEAGGTDDGITGVAENNFGIGRLVIGEEGSPTTVHVLDLFDNGNRGVSGEPEALYLGDFGNADGLLINGGSMLVLNDLNVYAWLDGEMKWLNELFDDEVNDTDLLAIPFGAGFLALEAPQPGDYDFDGDVDGSDFLAFQRGFGSTTNLASDGNHDGVVNAADYTIWRDGFGSSSLAQTVGSQSVVPEPASLVLVMLFAGGLISIRPRRTNNE